MKNYDWIFEIFGRLLEEGKIYEDSSWTFDSLCRVLGVGPASFGRYVFEQVGLSGDEILRIYRQTGG